MPGQAVSAAPFGGAADSTREREAGARPPGDAESAAVADAAAPAEVLNLGYCPSRRAQSASLLLVVRGNGFHQPCSLSLGAAMAARPVRLLIREHIVFGSQAALFYLWAMAMEEVATAAALSRRAGGNREGRKATVSPQNP